MNLISKVVCVRGMALVESSDLDTLKSKLKIKVTGDSDVTLSLYKERRDDLLWVPRGLVSKADIPVEDSPAWYTNSEWSTSIKLRRVQGELVGDWKSEVQNGNPYGGIIHAKTGTGKTIMGIHLASTIAKDMRTLVVVPTTYLMGQWKDEILLHTDITEDEIGYIQQDKCEIEGKKVVIAIINSVANREYPEYIYNSFGLCIVDEVHKLGAETFSKVGGLFHTKYNLGLSATPRRKDGTADVFHWHIGNIIATSNQLNAEPRVVMIPYKGKDTSSSGCFWNGKLSIGKYDNRLAKSKPRTELLGKIVSKLYDKGEDILLLSSRILMLDNIKAYLLSTGIPESDIGLFTSKHRETDRKIILATYGSAELGANIPRLTSLVLATPRVDIEQAVGRVLRKVDVASTVVDLVDVRSSIMMNWAKARLKRYKTMTRHITDNVTEVSHG